MIEQAVEKIAILLQGKIPAKFKITRMDRADDRRFAIAFNQLVSFMEEVHQFIGPLAHGQLSDIKWSPKNFLASPFKELHSRLSHLIWQAKQVASGDYHQRVDFMGEFSEAFNAMIITLERNEKLLMEKIDELEQALGHIKQLEGFLPICANCKRIRREGRKSRDPQSWITIEKYLSNRTDAKFTHSVCPDCWQKLYPDYKLPE